MKVLVVAILAVGACERTAPMGQMPLMGSGSANGSATSAPVETPKPVAKPVAPPEDPGFGSVAFKTYKSGGYAVRFKTAKKAEAWWANMAGETVQGTYEQNGPEIVVHWDPKYTNNGNSQERFRQMGPCSMALYEMTDRKTGQIRENTMIYQQREPRCDTVRLTK